MQVEISNDKIQKITQAGEEAEEMAHVVRALTIVSDAHYTSAGECLVEIKGRYKELEEQRTSITRPLLQVKKSIDEMFAKPKKSLKEAETSLKSGMGLYQRELARKRAEAEAIVAAKARAAEEAAAKAEAEGRPVEPPPVEEIRDAIVEAQVEAPKVQGVSVREVTKFELVDLEAIPREFLVPDESKIRHAVLSGATIPGVRVYTESVISSRSK